MRGVRRRTDGKATTRGADPETATRSDRPITARTAVAVDPSPKTEPDTDTDTKPETGPETRPEAGPGPQPGPGAHAARSRKKVKKIRNFDRPPAAAGARPTGHQHGPGSRAGRHATGAPRSAQNLAGHKHALRQQTTAGRRNRSALLPLVIILGIVVAFVAVIGAFVAGSMRDRVARFPAPLLIYPVSQVTAGECPAGTKGVTGQSANGPYCYQVTDGLAIRRVTDIHAQRGTDGVHHVSISLLPADRHAFADLTRKSVGRELAFVVRGRLITAPRVEMPITRGRVIIAGSFTRQAADRLVHELKGT